MIRAWPEFLEQFEAPQLRSPLPRSPRPATQHAGKRNHHRLPTRIACNSWPS
jgi:hypothetical protein